MELLIQEGYLAMFWFINSFYEERKDDGLGDLLGDLSPITFVNCISADPAAWDIWLDIINKFNLDDSQNKYIKDDELLIIIDLFLNAYAGSCFDIDIIYKNIRLLKSNPVDLELSKRWHNAIGMGKENSSKYFYGLL